MNKFQKHIQSQSVIWPRFKRWEESRQKKETREDKPSLIGFYPPKKP